MKKILMVASYTFRDLIKSKILLNVVILGGILSLITYISYSLTFAVPEKVALDVGLSLLTLSAVMIAIFMGVGLLSNEIESRTLYIVLSRPIGRTGFLLGKILGMALFLFIDLFILSSIIIFIYLLLGGQFDPLTIHVIFFIFIESIIVLSLVVFMSFLMNRPLAVLFTLFIYVLGFAVGAIKDMPYVTENWILKYLVSVYSWVFPLFSKINFKDFLLYNVNIKGIDLLFSYSYGIAYFVGISVITSFLFKNKNLD